jgi:hypothetical protein
MRESEIELGKTVASDDEKPLQQDEIRQIIRQPVVQGRVDGGQCRPDLHRSCEQSLVLRVRL